MALRFMFKPYTILAALYDTLVIVFSFTDLIDGTVKVIGLLLAAVVAWYTVTRLQTEIKVNRNRLINERLEQRIKEQKLADSLLKTKEIATENNKGNGANNN